MIVQLLKYLIYSIGTIGLLANAVLIRAILRHTPTGLRVYATIFLASAVCDCVGLASMMVTTVREVIFNGSCVLEFHGVCTQFGEEACWAIFGIQEHMYSTTVSLLCLSFAYRFYNMNNQQKAKQKACSSSDLMRFVLFQTVIIITFAIVLAHSHLIPSSYYSISKVSRQPVYMDAYKHHRDQTRAATDVSTTLGLIHLPDLLTFCVLNYSMLSVVICLIIIVILRRRTIKRFIQFERTMNTNVRSHQKTLSQALNLQLACSSFFFIGCIIFSINLSFENSPDIAFISVPQPAKCVHSSNNAVCHQAVSAIHHRILSIRARKCASRTDKRVEHYNECCCRIDGNDGATRANDMICPFSFNKAPNEILFSR